MPEDIRKTEQRSGPQTATGDGAAQRTGYGAGGLGAGGDRAHHGGGSPDARAWDAPGVTSEGHRTGSSTDGPRTAMDGESEPNADAAADRDDD
ncbi:hypothetical protein [Phenylobacterium sp.]|uniref:hypothetical protein n=1 Tax=Phenylobacterium sp. TaxID=1871053 RepID=UPI002C7CB45D|nr:hypothetical protein [Phenylobacterium sp.]HVI32039.1 hypothetical protein [Phenylobacterium sp.]